MDKRDRIASLLASGVKPSVVSSLVGCTDAYISQLKSDPEFKLYVEELSEAKAEEVMVSPDAARESERALHGDRIAGLEAKLLDSFLDDLPYMNFQDKTRLLAEVGKRRDAQDNREKGRLDREALLNAQRLNGGLVNNGTIQVVQLVIPQIAVPELQLSSNNEIVSIGDRSTAPMPTARLKDYLSGVKSHADQTSIPAPEGNLTDF